MPKTIIKHISLADIPSDLLNGFFEELAGSCGCPDCNPVDPVEPTAPTITDAQRDAITLAVFRFAADSLSNAEETAKYRELLIAETRAINAAI